MSPVKAVTETNLLCNKCGCDFSCVKKRPYTVTSSIAAEFNGLHICLCDVEGLGICCQDVDLLQEFPTTIIQDNEAAIRTAVNRGVPTKYSIFVRALLN